MNVINKQYVIKNKATGEIFSDFIEEGGVYKVLWNSRNPWIYSRECDALFVLYQGLELSEEADVVEYV